MKRDTKSRWRSTLLALPALLAVGCSSSGVEHRTACGAVGAESQVNVRWTRADFIAWAKKAANADSLLVRLCVRKACDTTSVPNDDAHAPFARMKLDDRIGEVTVPVRFTVTSPDHARALFDDHADVALRKFQPNGPDCGPTVFDAALTADPRHGLTTVHR